MGIGSGGNATFKTTDIDKLLKNTIFAAAFELSFGIEVDLKPMAESESEDAIAEGILLRIDHWGAYASIVVDPIELTLQAGASLELDIRESSFALGVTIASQGTFEASLADLIKNVNLNATGLVPTIEIPLQCELLVDISAGSAVSVKITPIVKLSSSNLLTGEFDFEIDAGESMIVFNLCLFKMSRITPLLDVAVLVDIREREEKSFCASLRRPTCRYDTQTSNDSDSRDRI
jgi:hypothetical protein